MSLLEEGGLQYIQNGPRPLQRGLLSPGSLTEGWHLRLTRSLLQVPADHQPVPDTQHAETSTPGPPALYL